MKKKKKKISNAITAWLVVIVVTSCAVSAILTYIALLHRTDKNAVILVRQHVEDVSNDIDELADAGMLTFLGQFMDGYLDEDDKDDLEDFSRRLHEYYKDKGIEVNIVNSDGIIEASSVPDYIGYDMHDGEQSSEFLALLDGTADEYIQEMRPSSYDGRMMKYAGKRFPDGSGFIEVGLTKELYYEEIAAQGGYSATNRHIGETGYLLVCSDGRNIINSYHNRYTGKSIFESGIDFDPGADYKYESRKCDVFGDLSYVTINKVKGICIIGVYPVKEAIQNVNNLMNATIMLEIVVFLILFIVLVILLRKRIVDNMIKVNTSLSRITEGNLDEKIDVRDTVEFDQLSTDINETVDKLKEYIAEAAARIDEDLEVARAIQKSVLPGVFPMFTGRDQFELFASMDAAKEVGGDFYDFFMIGEDTLGFLIADVSGKSIPGAMLMMSGKAIIKSLAERGMPPADVFTAANEKLCEGNDEGYFITAWLGYLDLNTGLVRVANAGHNAPLLIRNGRAEYVSLKPGLMLAGSEGMIYKEQTVQMQKGDILFLYTDGVTEAMDEKQNQYGEDRLQDLLSFGDSYPAPSGENGIAGAVCEAVKNDVEGFVKGAEQSDDITMLCIRFLGN